MARGLPSSVTESVAKRTTTLLAAARFAAPAAPEGVEQRDELGRLAGLAQVVIKTEVLGQALLGAFLPRAGNRDEQRRERPAPLADFPRHRVAAHARHVDVEDQGVGADQAVDLAHLVAAQRDVHVMALVAQDRGEDLGGVAVVVGHEYTQPHGPGGHGVERTLKPGALLRMHWLWR